MFSILIPTVNNPTFLQLCIAYAERHTALEHEILIFNNGSDRTTTQWIRSLPYKCLHAPRNRGVCYAYNALAHQARGDYFLLWDDDKLLLPRWDVELLPLLRSDGQFSWKSLVEIWPHNTNPCSVFGDYGRSPETFDESRLLQDLQLIDFPRKVSLAVSQVMSRDLYFAVGGYDELFYPGFGSDPDIMWRSFCFLGRDPKRFCNANRSFYYHFTSATTNRIFRYPIVTKALRLWGRALFLTKHGFSVVHLRRKTHHGSLLC
jgi:glycosyltransferase involved in cell wall biosynthesis